MFAFINLVIFLFQLGSPYSHACNISIHSKTKQNKNKTNPNVKVRRKLLRFAFHMEMTTDLHICNHFSHFDKLLSSSMFSKTQNWKQYLKYCWHDVAACIIFHIKFVCVYMSREQPISIGSVSMRGRVRIRWACLVEGFNTLALAGGLNLPDKWVDALSCRLLAEVWVQIPTEATCWKPFLGSYQLERHYMCPA